MKRLLLLLSLLIFPFSLKAQKGYQGTPFPSGVKCTTLSAITATGYTLITFNPGDTATNPYFNFVAVQVGYRTTGSPTSVSVDLEAGYQTQATNNPNTIGPVITATAQGELGTTAGQWSYFYIHTNTLSGGSSPSIIPTACVTNIANPNIADLSNMASKSSGSNEIVAFCTGTVASAQTEYLTFGACSGATAATGRWIVSTAGTLQNLQVFSSAAVVGGASVDVLTVYKNGSATALTCTIAAAGTTCADTTHTVTVAAGDALTFQFVTATSDTAANISIALQKI